MLDDTDLRILELLQTNARISNAEIARQIDLAASAVLERIRRMEERGVILGYETRIRPAAVGCGLLAFIFVRTDLTDATEATTALHAIPEIQEIHDIAGEDCFLVKVRTQDPESLGRFLRERLYKIPGVSSTRSTVVLQTEKETTNLPVRRKNV